MAGFSGMDELIADLTSLPKALEGEAAKLITGAATGMESDVRQSYRRGETGNLINGVGQRREGPLRIRVYSRAAHVHLYEFGTVERFHKSGKSVGTMPAKPTFIPAAVRHRARMMNGFREMLRRIKVRDMTGSA